MMTRRSPMRSASRPMSGAVERDRHRRRGNRQADLERRRAESPRQERQQRLRHVEVEEGRRSGEITGSGRRASHRSYCCARACFSLSL